MTADVMVGKSRLSARAVLLADRLELRALEAAERLAERPLVVKSGVAGCAVSFRYGAMVLFEVSAPEERSLVDALGSRLHGAFDQPDSEAATIMVDPGGEDRVDSDGTIHLVEPSLQRIQLIADVLAKSELLAHYEARIAGVFDRVEPLAEALRSAGLGGLRERALLREIGEVLLTQHRMLGRAEVADKPDTLWDHPELERLYAQLYAEYELHDRHRTLDRKLELISRTVQTFVELLQDKRTLRVEWYIVILIVVEILFTIYDQFIAH